MKRYFWFVVILLLIWIPITTAQSDSLLAFLNGSGQLVVSSGDGATRWIVTNPGQQIDTSRGFAWTDDGNLVFALVGAGAFLGEPDTQNITAVEANDVQTLSYLRGLSSRPNLAQPQGISSDGQYAFVWDGSSYLLVNLQDNTGIALPLTGENNTQGSGLWADTMPLVAYSGVDSNGSTALSVIDAPSQNSVTVPSGRSVPILPITWIPDTEYLIFRAATGDVLLADVSCVATSCTNNPFDNSIAIAPSSANHIQVTDTYLFYVDGEQLIAADITCVDDNLSARQVLGAKVVPLSLMHVGGDILAYTSYANNPSTPTDRIVTLVDLTCIPNCQPQPIINGAVAGLLSPDGAYLMIDSIDAGMNILDVSGGSFVYLTETMGGQLGAGLTTARWR